MPLAEIKDFNAFIDNKPVFDHSVKNKQEAYEKLVERSRSDDYTTGLFVLSKILQTYWYRFIKTSKYKYYSIN